MRLYQCLTGSVLPWWETRERVQRLPSWFVFAGADSHFPLDPDGTCRSPWKVPRRSRHSQESTTEFTENHRERWSPGDGRGLHRTPTSRTAQGDRSARLKKTISNSIAATLKMQRWPKERAIDRGGWRYVDDFNEQIGDAGKR